MVDLAGSRILAPEAVAANLGIDTSRESQLSVDERIRAAIRRHGPLATKKQGDEGDVFVGPLNDYTLAEIAAIPLQGRLVLDRACGIFYAFDESSGIFKKMTREESGRSLNVVYANLPALSPILKSLGCRPCSVRMMRSLLDAMSATVGEDHPFGGDPDSRSPIISRPIANGLLRFGLISGEVEFRPGLEPSDRALHRAPVCYDPHAGAVPSRLLEELLTPALGSAEMACEFMDDMAAAWLGGSLWAGVFCLIGAADAGKSQLVEMLRLLHGKPHWCALSSKSVSEKFGSSFLSGPVRVVSFTDAKGTALTGETGALIKALTGGDVVEDRGPHAQLLVSIPGDKVFVLVSNSPPNIDFEEDVDAWVRRVRPYRFQAYHVERRVADFAKVLLCDEGSAILNRLIEGAKRRMRLMIDGKRPEMKPHMLEVLNEILNRSCAVSEFCESRIVAERGGQVNRTEFYNLFTDWQIKERGGRIMARDEFNRRAEDAMRRKFSASLSNSCDGGKGWRGCRWKTACEKENGD